MLCSVLSFSLSPLFLWVFFCCAFFKKWSSWFAQNSYCILKVALFLSLSRYSMGQGKRPAYFLYLLELSNNSRCFERRSYPFCNPCHHLTTIWSLPPSSYSVFPYWIYSIVISFMLWYPENPCLIILAPFLPQQSPFLFLPPNNPGMRQNSLLLKFLLT